ncbi:MAG: alpha/beta hydrolase-fold protein [Candidatus Zixiibacteriota bacterium]
MKQVMRIGTLTAIIAMALVSGCSDRGPNSSGRPDLQKGGILRQQGGHVFSSIFKLQIQNPFEQLQYSVYLPKVAFPPTAHPVPLLILLAPQGENEDYFFRHGLQQVADELISSGKIRPMAIACIENAASFGGMFYAGRSPGAGYYDILLQDSLVAYLRSTNPALIPSWSKTAIGGIGQGAYGAFRAAIMKPDLYCAVSAIDGPLDFDGLNGNGGLIPLFMKALDQQGLLGKNQYKNEFDSGNGGGQWRASSLLCGGAMAFSPHDTMVACSTVYTVQNNITTVRKYVYDRETITDNTTLITHVTGATAGVQSWKPDFHLPFDKNGAPYAPIWNLWMENNLETLLAENPNSLNGVKMWIGTSPESELGYHEMTKSFIRTLEHPPYYLGSQLKVREFTGYDEWHKNDRNQYLYDLFEPWLIFHSEAFGAD